MNKYLKRTIVSLSIIVPSLVITYFVGGLIAFSIIDPTILGKRGSSLSDLDTLTYRVFKTRNDFPSLANREEYTFRVGDYTLYGYLYETPSPKGLVVTAHGVNSLAESDHAIYHDYFLNEGFDVFVIDMVGCGKSEGIMGNLYRSKECVENALDKISHIDKLNGLPICLFGHSWGAYGVVTSTYTHQNVKAVASVSGYELPSEMMYDLAIQYSSPALAFTKPTFLLGCATHYGNDLFVSASEAIISNPSIPYFITHGEFDKTVDFNNCSQYQAMQNKPNDNVTFYLMENMAHNAPWRSIEAHDYYETNLKPKIRDLEKQYGENIPNQEIEQLVSEVDFEKSSEANIDLLSRITSFYLTNI